MKGFAKAIIGSLLLCALALAGRYLLAEWYIERVGNAAQKSLANIQANSQRQLQAIKDKQAAEQQAKQVVLQQQQETQAIADKAAAEKAQAWNDYYKEPKDCLSWQSDAHMVKCVNHKMKAKQEFERMWAAGGMATTAAPTRQSL